MWSRLKAVFRSLFGWMIRGVENPEMILRQHMDDMRDKVPGMRNAVAEVVKLQKMLQIQVDRLEKKVAILKPKIEAAVKMGPGQKDNAKTMIGIYETSVRELEETRGQNESAKVQSEQAKMRLTAFENQIQDKIRECMTQIGRAKRAQMQEEVSEVMGAFEVGDVSDTVDQMTERIDERLARSEAKLEVAGETSENQMAKFELDVVEAESEDTYVEWQRQLGLAPEVEAPERTMDEVSVEDEGYSDADLNAEIAEIEAGYE